MSSQPQGWWIYQGTGRPRPERDLSAHLPAPPRWRTFSGGPVQPAPSEDDTEFERRLGTPPVGDSQASVDEISMVNAALYLRRPLLVSGNPGTGKSSLAYKIARELRLGPVLRWPITSRSKIVDGLWGYDAIGRVQAAASNNAEADPDIGKYVQLGPLGTALLPYEQPRVLLIDELDKSDIDLPNDLLNLFEDGEYLIPPLVRIAATQPEVRVFTADYDVTALVDRGRVMCRAFPIIVVTTNGERDFPPAFLRRCLRLDMPNPVKSQLVDMVAAHFPRTELSNGDTLIQRFVDRRDGGEVLATDQLLNAMYLSTSGAYQRDEDWGELVDALWKRLGTVGTD